jgi:hypothetical protein
MKITSKKIFYFAFIIILIGIIWTMFFSKSREGNAGRQVDPCNANYTSEEACNASTIPGGCIARYQSGMAGFWCGKKVCSDYSSSTNNAYNNFTLKSNCTKARGDFGNCKASNKYGKLVCSN